MEKLSEKLAELSVQAKNAEDHAEKARMEAREGFEQRREQLRNQAHQALDKADQGLSKVSAEAQSRANRLKAKVQSDVEQLKQHASESGHKFEAWQADNYADDKEKDAAACIEYAIAAVKIAELAVIDAIEARQRADAKQG